MRHYNYLGLGVCIKAGFSYLLVLMFMTGSCVLAGSNDGSCTKEDKEYAKFWKDYYKPSEAYEFGVKLQDIIREKKLNKLFELVDGELTNGPRKTTIKDKNISDVFSEEWQRQVLTEKPSCRPVGWRGFMLGNGLVWFNKFDKGWYVFSINGWKEGDPKKPDLPVTWDVGEKILSPQCFKHIWISADNFEEYEEQYNIKDINDFRKNTGKYLGKVIPTLQPIVPSWADKGQTISLVGDINECAVPNNKLIVNDRSVQNKVCEDTYCTEHEYELLAEVSRKDCNNYAPHIPGQCQNAFLVSVGSYSGGSMGWDYRFNIYGLFVLRDKSKVVVPLVNFYKKNNALNYIDMAE